MNDLSWFLYLAGTLPQVSWAIRILSFLGLVASLFFFAVYLLDKVSHGDLWQNLHPWRFAWLWCAIPFVASFLVPEKETFYAIAASEMGEEVLNSKIGGKAQRALEQWLDRQIFESDEEEF